MSDTAIHIERISASKGTLHDERIIVWADRTHDHCDLCREPITVEITAPPVELDPPHGVVTRNLQHGCGAWLAVHCQALSGDASEHRVQQAVTEVRGLYDADLAERTEVIRRELVDQLQAVAAGDGQATGSEIQPGVMYDGDERLAWDYSPLGGQDGSIVEVSEREVIT